MSTEAHDKTIKVNGVQLAVREYGSADKAKRTVVMLHGFCLDKDSWTIQAEELAEKWGDDVRVISYDHRGHGQSATAPMNTYTIKQLALDLAGVLKKMKVDGPLTLTGHSMGGMTIITYMGLPAAQRPIDPEHTVLVATTAGDVYKHGIGIMLNTPAVGVIRKAARRSPEGVADFILRNLMRPLSGVLVRSMGEFEGNGKAQAALAAASINATPIRTKAGFLTPLRELDEFAALNTFHGNVIILSGGNDYLTPAAHARRMAKQISEEGNATVRHIHFTGSGHMILHDEPASVTAALNLGIVGSDIILDEKKLIDVIGGEIDVEVAEAV